MSLWGQKENVSNKVNSPPICDFMNEIKGTKIFNLNLLKFDCQNLPFRRSLASSKLNPFLFPQEPKFNLETTSKTIQWTLSQGLASFCTFVSWEGRGEFKRDTA